MNRNNPATTADRLARIARRAFLSTRIRSFLTALALGSFGASVNADVPADYVLTNGKVYTVNDTQPWVEAVAVRDNSIVFVGSAEGAVAYVGDETRVGDLQGKLVMPGIVESHLHLMLGAVARSGVWVADIPDVE